MLAACPIAAVTTSSSSLRREQCTRHAKSHRRHTHFHATNSIGDVFVGGESVLGARNKRNSVTATDLSLRRLRHRNPQPHHRRVRKASALVGSEQQTSASSPTSAVDNLPRADDSPPAAVEAFLKRNGRHAVFRAAKGGSIDVHEVPGGRTLMEYMSAGPI